MNTDITLGQYLPGTSVLHRLDPRAKILFTLLYLVTVFLVRGPVSYLLTAALILLCTFLGKIPSRYLVRGLKPLIIIILFTAVLNLFLNGAGGEVLWQWKFLCITESGVRNALYFAFRLIFLVLGTSVLTLTTSPIALTDGLEQLFRPLQIIHFPAHELAMMMTIALRFIPTLLDETDKIMKAQTSRGADFESGNLLKRARALVPLLIPLFISSFRRASELAMAMEARCYRGGEGRTRMRVLKMSRADLGGFAVMALYLACVIVERSLI